MSHLQYFNYPGFGERVRKDFHYSQAVRIDNRIEISGQGGWDRETEKIPSNIGLEVDQAFENVSVALKQAGGKGWEQVYKLRIFWIEKDGLTFGEIAGEAVRNMEKWCPEHAPLMTFIEVKGLYDEMKIEIEAEAHLG